MIDVLTAIEETLHFTLLGCINQFLLSLCQQEDGKGRV